MKKYTLIVAIGALLCIPQAKAMEKKLTASNMPLEDRVRLRTAVVDYKKSRSRERAQQIINEYNVRYTNDPLVMAKRNEIRRFKEAEEKKLQESRIEEEHACAICMEDQELEPIPCKNKHADLMCNACLGQIKNKTNLCPICREPLVD